MIDNLTLTALESINSQTQPVTIVTGIKYNASLLKVFNNVTFLYDPNWTYEQGNPTYPIAFFYVKSMRESMESEVSQKPMLFYNTVPDNKDATSGGILNIVTDNIIIKPKTYTLDVLIPANSSTLKNTSFSFDSMRNVNGFAFSNGTFQGSTGMSYMTKAINSMLDFFTTLFTALYGSSMSASVVCSMLLQQQDYNKASIEYMWRNRRILKLKLWTGWSFKYLSIKDFSVEKIGENGDFYTGTLTCQEMPILTFRSQNKSALSILSSISATLGTLQKATTAWFIKTMTTTLGGE